MSRYGIPFNADNAQIRCIAHVVNLVVQKILAVLKEVDADPDAQDYYELFLKHFPIHFSYDDDEDLREWEAEGDDGDEGDDDDVEVIDMSAVQDEDEEEFDDEEEEEENLTALEKLRTACKKIVSTPQSRAAFRSAAQKELRGQMTAGQTPTPLARLMVVRDMKAIDSWVISHDQYRHLLLGKKEWGTLKKLNSILQIFTKVTKTMSRASTPTLPWTIPMYEHMRKNLEEHINDTSLDESLREACAAGHQKLMEYYTIVKKSQHTILATVLHPGLRANWFKNLSTDDYNGACTLFRHVFDEYARDHVPATAPLPSDVLVDDDYSFLATVGALPDPIASERASSRSEADRWLAGEGGAGNLNFPLMWYKVCDRLLSGVYTDNFYPYRSMPMNL
ncbi:hypothetical protein BD626DRAFT_414065 [Schizophyllum amplum]|uniref:Uncharacterized protein n=1 Tax=Schizophyllum amplum TaxID=97359 RepID=A0A550BV29_9AGAR|nr:hypothetical protein BD626DRAFT_414065 [Auriculariopsis ampla]